MLHMYSVYVLPIVVVLAVMWCLAVERNFYNFNLYAVVIVLLHLLLCSSRDQVVANVANHGMQLHYRQQNTHVEIAEEV